MKLHEACNAEANLRKWGTKVWLPGFDESSAMADAEPSATQPIENAGGGSRRRPRRVVDAGRRYRFAGT